MSSLDLSGINLGFEPEQPPVSHKNSENHVVDLTVDAADLSNTLSATEDTMEATFDKSSLLPPLSSHSQDNNSKIVDENSEVTERSASFSGSSNNVLPKHSDRLSTSWPCSNTKSTNQQPVQTNLSFLSPNTLKMLNIKDPTKFVPTFRNEDMTKDEEEFGLLKVANRLNQAAAKCSRRRSEERSSPLLCQSDRNSPLSLRSHSRSPSVDRGHSPMLDRPFSPIVGVRQRSQSVDRTKTEVQIFTPFLMNANTRYSSIVGKLPEKPFSPPSRMLDRSKSLSVEKESMEAKILQNTTRLVAPFIPDIQSGTSELMGRGRSVSDPVYIMPKPVSFSSPISNKLDADREIETTELKSPMPALEREIPELVKQVPNLESEITETEKQTTELLTSENLDKSESNEIVDDATETIVVMTDSGENLSDEDAIKLVNDMLELRSSSFELEPDQNAGVECESSQTCEDNVCIDRNNSLDTSGNSDVLGGSSNYDNVNKLDIENNVHPDSPFIPQMEVECFANKCVRRNTGESNTNNIPADVKNEKASTCMPGQCVVDDSDKEDKGEYCQLEEVNSKSKLILIGVSSDDDSDIMDITDSVVNASAESPNSQCLSSENKVPEIQDQSSYTLDVEEILKRNVDESIDSDIELLEMKDCGNISQTGIDKLVSIELNNSTVKENATDIKTSEETVRSTDSGSNEIMNIPNFEYIDKDEIDGNNYRSQKVKAGLRQKLTGQSSSKEWEAVKHGDVSTYRECSDEISEQSEKTHLVQIRKDNCQQDKEVVEHCANEKEVLKYSQQSPGRQVDDTTYVANYENSDVGNKDAESHKQTIDERSNSAKEEVLRGLGLGTSDEVEKLKNSPQKSPSLPLLCSPVVKRKCVKCPPIKTYPLRNNTTSPARYKDSVEVYYKKGAALNPIRENVDIQTDLPKEIHEQYDLKQFVCRELSPELPVLDPIAKKIKEESIAKSCPGEKGPFKCSKCRRQYRTESSYTVHVENCNFLVSSSDEEDVAGIDEESDVEPRETRSMKTRKQCIEKVENTYSSDDDFNETAKRTSLRRNTQFQRVAIEVAEKRLKEEECSKRGRGRPSLKTKDSTEIEKDKHQKELIAKETIHGKHENVSDTHTLEVKRARGRPRKSEVICRNVEDVMGDFVIVEENLSLTEIRRKSREAKLLEGLSQSSDSEPDETKQQMTLTRKRGRPRKISINSSVVENDSNDEEPPVAKRKLRNSDSVDKDSLNEQYHDEMDIDYVSNGSRNELKSQIEWIRRSRCRPARMVYIQKRHKTIRTYIKDIKQVADKIETNKFGHKSVSVRLEKIGNSIQIEENAVISDDGSDGEKCLNVMIRPKRRRGRPPFKTKQRMDLEHDNVSCSENEDVQLKEAVNTNQRRERHPSKIKERIESEDLGEAKHSSTEKEDEIVIQEIRQLGRGQSSSKTESASDREDKNNSDEREGEEPKVGTNCNRGQPPSKAESNNKMVNSEIENSSDVGDSILDDETGWIIDKTSGEKLWSPTQKKIHGDLSENVVKEIEQDDKSSCISNEVNTDEIDTIGDGNNQAIEITGGNDADCTQTEVSTDKDELTCAEMEVGTNSSIINTDAEIDKRNNYKKGDDSRSLSEELKAESESHTPHNLSEELETSELGAIQSMELQGTGINLPQTVLKLLKDGHKVVIRNPTLNKCFMWQKTADGYTGKPFDKKLTKTPSISKKLDKSLKEAEQDINQTVQQINNAGQQKHTGSVSTINTGSSLTSMSSNIGPQTASELLLERKKSEVEQVQQELRPGLILARQCKDHLTERPEILKRKARFVVENIERLIETNKRAKAVVAFPQQLPRGSAEYVGGILISPPRSVSIDEVKQTIQNTVPIASNMLQNTFMQNQILNYGRNIQNSLTSSFVQAPFQCTIPVVTQSSFPIIQQPLQASMGINSQTCLQTVSPTALQQFPQANLQNPTVFPGTCNAISMSGFDGLPAGSQYAPTQVVQQAVQMQVVPQIPTFKMGMINIPVMTSIGQLIQPMPTVITNTSQPLMNSQTSPVLNHQALQPVINTPSSQSLLNQQAFMAIETSQHFLNPQVSRPLMNPQKVYSFSQPRPTYNQTQQIGTSNCESKVSPRHILSKALLSPNQNTPIRMDSTICKQLDGVYQKKLTGTSDSQSNIDVQSSKQSSPQHLNVLPHLISDSIPTQRKTSLNVDLSPCATASSIPSLKGPSPHRSKLDDSSVKKGQTQYFKVLPGLGGGSSNLLKKMHSYLSWKQKPIEVRNLSPRILKKKIPYTGEADDSNGLVQMKYKAGAKSKMSSTPTRRPSQKKQTSSVEKGFTIPRKRGKKPKKKMETCSRKWIRGPYQKKHARKTAGNIALPHKTGV